MRFSFASSLSSSYLLTISIVSIRRRLRRTSFDDIKSSSFNLLEREREIQIDYFMKYCGWPRALSSRVSKH